ncbi:MAG: type II secretion system F family protein [Parcubacteria group bacterium]|nr:type II secretion system F family protein [Parcubacteria group bacterium]
MKRTFSYVARNKEGKLVRGKILESNTGAAKKSLERKEFSQVMLREYEKTFLQRMFRFQIGSVRFVDKLLFTKHLSVMTHAGITIDEALEILQSQSHMIGFQNVLRKIHSDILSGENLSASMRKHPKVFDTLYVNVIAAGEQSGTLDESLDNLSIQMKKTHELRQKIKAAMYYPMFVLFLTLTLGFTLSVFVLPKITPLFSGLNVELPIFTKILLFLAAVFGHYGVQIVLVFALAVFVIVTLFRAKSLAPVIHAGYLRTPFIRKIVRDVNLALFCRTLGTLLRSGLTINEALDISADTLKNNVYKRKLHQASVAVQSGKSLSEFLESQEEYFPPLVYRMLNTGEETGKLDNVLMYLAEFYEQEVDNVAKNLSTILEPLLLAVIGLVVGFLAVAIIAPIYQITSGFLG